jgi:hypothetical protein
MHFYPSYTYRRTLNILYLARGSFVQSYDSLALPITVAFKQGQGAKKSPLGGVFIFRERNTEKPHRVKLRVKPQTFHNNNDFPQSLGNIKK